jgi:hypothetical protein
MGFAEWCALLLIGLHLAEVGEPGRQSSLAILGLILLMYAWMACVEVAGRALEGLIWPKE